MKHLLTLFALAAFAGSSLATDLAVTASSVVPGARAKPYGGNQLAGVAITAGQLVYLDAASNTFKLADSDASASTSQVLGYAANSAAVGQFLVVITEDDDYTPGATLSTSAPIYVVSATAGAIAPSADITTGYYAAVVMIAKSTTKAAFKIVRGTVPTTFTTPRDESFIFAAAHAPARMRLEETEIALAA